MTQKKGVSFTLEQADLWTSLSRQKLKTLTTFSQEQLAFLASGFQTQKGEDKVCPI